MAKKEETVAAEPLTDIGEMESAMRMNQHIMKALQAGTYPAKECPAVADAMAMVGNMMIQINNRLSSLKPKKRAPAGKRKAPAKKTNKGKKKK